MANDQDLQKVIDDLYGTDDDDDDEAEESPKRTCEPLMALAARVAGKHYTINQLETHDVMKVEHALKEVLYWAFPQSEDSLKMMASLCHNDESQWQTGEKMAVETCVQEIQQVGFSVSAVINKNESPRNTEINEMANVFLTFEKQVMTSSSCSCCSGMLWCRHVVAVVLYRLKNPQKVPVHLPVMDTLAGLSKLELQTALQFAIQEDPGGILPRVFKHINSLKDSDSKLSQIQGLPDPTFGLHADDKRTLDLSMDIIQENCITAIVHMRYSCFNTSYSSVFDFVEKVNTPIHEQFLAKVKTFILNGDTDIAGRILIKMAKTVLDDIVQRRPHMHSEEIKRLFYDMERLFSCFIVRFTGTIRKEMIETALDLNGISAGLEHFCFLLTSEWVKLDLNEVVGTSEVFSASPNAPFYQPLCASVILEDSQLWWDRFDQTTSNTMVSEEALSVVMLRFDSLLLLGGTNVHRKLCKLGLAILENLLERSLQHSIVGPQGNVQVPVLADSTWDEPGPSHSKRPRMNCNELISFGAESGDNENQDICMAQTLYCLLYICYTIYHIPDLEKLCGLKVPVLMEATLRALEMCRLKSFVVEPFMYREECTWYSKMECFTSEKFLELQSSFKQEYIRQWIHSSPYENQITAQSRYLAALSEKGIGYYGDKPALKLIKLLVQQEIMNPNMAVHLSCDVICYSSKPFKCFSNVGNHHAWAKMNKDTMENTFRFFFEKILEDIDFTRSELLSKILQHIEASTDLEFRRLALTALEKKLPDLASFLQYRVLNLVLHTIRVSAGGGESDTCRAISHLILRYLSCKMILCSLLQPILSNWEYCSELFYPHEIDILAYDIGERIKTDIELLLNEDWDAVFKFLRGNFTHKENVLKIIQALAYDGRLLKDVRQAIIESHQFYTPGALLMIANFVHESQSNTEASGVDAFSQDVFQLLQCAFKQMEHENHSEGITAQMTSQYIPIHHIEWCIASLANYGTPSSQFSIIVESLRKNVHETDTILALYENIQSSESLLNSAKDILGDKLINCYHSDCFDEIHECRQSSKYRSILQGMERALENCMKYVHNGGTLFKIRVTENIAKNHKTKRKFMSLLRNEFQHLLPDNSENTG